MTARDAEALTAGQPARVEIEGKLLRSSQTVAVILLIFLLGIIAVAERVPALGIGVIGLGLALLLLHIFWPHHVGWLPRARLIAVDEGVVIRRWSGDTFAKWSHFDKVTLQPVQELGDDSSRVIFWKLTLHNAMKPVVSSFLHTKSSEQSLFYFPLTILFRADSDEAQALYQYIYQRIAELEPAEIAARAKPRAASEDVLRLHRCAQCTYSLQGLPDHGYCPECGWVYSDDMFILDGNVRSTTIPFGLQVLIAIPLLTIMFFSTVLGIVAVVSYVALQQTTLLRRIGLIPIDNFLVTKDGIEQWRKMKRWRMYQWADLRTIAVAQNDFEQWRLACWIDRKHRVRFAKFLEHWRTRPHGAPDIDISLRANPADGALICEELARRYTAATGNDITRVDVKLPQRQMKEAHS